MKAELLFTAGYERTIATNATTGFLWDKAVEFAEAFDGTEADPRFAVYTQLFCQGFRPGWDIDPRSLIAKTNELASPAIEALKRCISSTPERKRAAAEAEAEQAAREAASKAEREAYAAKKQAESQAIAESEKAADELLSPKTLEAVLVKDLPISGFSKNAFDKEGIETVGEVLAYKEAKPLSSIRGISDSAEATILEAIESLRKQFETE